MNFYCVPETYSPFPDIMSCVAARRKVPEAQNGRFAGDVVTVLFRISSMWFHQIGADQPMRAWARHSRATQDRDTSP